MNKDPRSPFNWRQRMEPSIFAQDTYFRTRTDGKTDSQRATEVVERKKVDGVSPPVVRGISKKERTEKALAYKHFGVYTKATPSVRQPNKHEQ